MIVYGRKNKDNVMISDMFFIFNYVEFTQVKLRIACDTTVNDYLWCNGVKCLGPSFTHNYLTNDTSYVCFVELCVDWSANYSTQVLGVAYLPIITSYDGYFKKAYLNVSYRCDYS